MPRVHRYGSVGMRLVEPAPTLVLAAGGRALVALSEREYAQRVLQVFELPGQDPAADDPLAGAVRHVGPRIAAWSVAERAPLLAAVIGDEDTRVALLRLPDLSVVARHEAGGRVSAVAVSPEGDRVVAGLDTGEIVRLDSGGRRAVLARVARPTAIAFARSGDRVVVGTESGVVEVVWVAEVKVLTTLRGGRGRVHNAAFTPDESRVVAGCGQELLSWSVRGGQPSTIGRGQVAMSVVGFTAGGHLVASSAQEYVAAYDTDSRRPERDPRGVGGPNAPRTLWSVDAYGPAAIAGDRVWTSRFELLREHDADTGAVRHTITAAQFVEGLAPMPSAGPSAVVVALASGKELRLADLGRGVWSGGAGGHDAEVTTVRFAGDRFVTGGRDARATVWRVDQGKPLATVVAPSGNPQDIVGAVWLEPDAADDRLWVGFGERVARCNPADGTCDLESDMLGALVTLIAPITAADGAALLLACTASRVVRPRPEAAGRKAGAPPEPTRRLGSLVLLDRDTLKVVHADRVDRTYTRARLRGDGCVRLDGSLGWAVYDPRKRVFVERGVLPSRDPSREHHRAADDSLLVEVANRPRRNGGARGLIWVTELPAQWTLIDGLETVELCGRAALSASGRYFATPHVDGRVRLWDLEQGECAHEWDLGVRFSALWFFPDEWRLLGSTSEGGLLQLSEPAPEPGRAGRSPKTPQT